MKKVGAVGISLILALNFAIILEISPGVSGGTIYVDDDYTVEDATHKMTIQAAVDAALPGDEVFVYSGYYPENLWIDKSINLTGEDKNTTVIYGGLSSDSVTIFASWVNVSGFKITGGNPNGVYITSFSEHNTVYNNMISDNLDSGVQIYWFSNYNNIVNNTIMNHSNFGVQLLYGNNYNKVADNVIENTTTSSVFIANPSGANPNFNNIVSNNFINNSQFGVYLYNLNDLNRIDGNFINNSQYGIMLSTFNDENVITKNTILTSSSLNLYLWNNNNDNIIYHNNFLNSFDLAYDDGVNIWNLSYPGGGNFWGNYSGGDNRSGPAQDVYGNDGFGDVPIKLGGGNNKDLYPLWPNWDALKYYIPSPHWKNVCEYALGDIEVSVIFVESNGSIDAESEDWSDSRMTLALGEIDEALNWWETQEPDAHLNLSINDLGRRNTSYEPITRIDTDSEKFVEEILGNYGFITGNYAQRLLNFNRWRRESAGSDWAFTIFVVDSYNDTDGYFANPPATAWAWMFVGGIVMTYDNGPWGISRMNNVTAHETGHMFYASDEYTRPGERGGYLYELEVDDSGMLMDNNNLVLSSGSKLQVGWRDTDSDGIMDILDTEPNTYLEPYEPDPTYDSSTTYSGHAVVVPYPCDNPSGFGLAITLNTISKVQFRVDNGSWENASAADGAFDEDKEEYTFTLSGLTSGTYFIETRAFNNWNNSDPTYANDTITIISDLVPPDISETTIDVPVSGKFYNVTANVIDDISVDSVWLDFAQTSQEGYSEKVNVSMNVIFGDEYWYYSLIWMNATWFNYTISASDTGGNWNTTSLRSLNFRVHNLDSGFGFTGIQFAIDDVDTLDGHTVFVEEGTYYENVVVDKSIDLTGEDKKTTIIDGGGNQDVVRVIADRVNITSFKVINSGSIGWPGYDAGIHIDSNFNNIYNIRIESNYFGILVGIYSHNKLYGNEIINNQYAVRISSSSNNSVMNNNISSNNIGGIWVDFSDNITIIGNYIANNDWGLWFSGSEGNTAYHNYFIDNMDQAFDDSNNGNQWDNGYPSGGNYWSDYVGEDLYSGPNQDIVGNDGIGDTNYSIDSDSVDRYPLLLGVGDNIFLYEGWNLISIPAIQSVTDLDSVLGPIAGSYDAVRWYDITDSSDHWKHNHISKPSEMNDLDSINHTRGLFIHITDSPGVVFEYGGLKLSVNQSITLNKGWNLVGFPSLGSYNRSLGLNNLQFGVDVDAIQWFDASEKTWHFLEEGDFFVPGRGYWMHSKVDAVWDVPL